MRAPQLHTSDFLNAILKLLPRGRAWPKSPTVYLDANGAPQIAADAPIMVQALATLAPTYERNAARAANLLIDAFPATTVELLPDWEESLGLPDPCAGESTLISQRQAQVVARLTGRSNNQSQAFFINFAASLGYDITITQFAPFRVGISAVGQPLYGSAWANAWQINAPQFTIEYFAIGDAVGEPLASWGSTVLQCEMERLSPGHTQLIFSY